MPYRNHTWAQSSPQSMPQMHLQAAERRSPPSPHLARLGRIRRRSTHRCLGHTSVDSKASGMNVQNDTNLRDRIKIPSCIPVSDARLGRQHWHWGRANTSKTPRQDSGTFKRCKFVLRRHRPAWVTFVRVRVVGTWQERFNLLFELIMPQHSNSAPRTHIADRIVCAPSNGTTPSPTGAAASISTACV